MGGCRRLQGVFPSHSCQALANSFTSQLISIKVGEKLNNQLWAKVNEATSMYETLGRQTLRVYLREFERVNNMLH